MTRKLIRSSFAIASVTLLFGVWTTIANAQATTLDQRLTQYIKDRRIDTKNKAIEQNVKFRCPIAQTSLKTLQTNVATVQKNRGDSYKNITESVTDLKNRLNDQAFEITMLKSTLDTYNGKVATYTSDVTNYKQAIDDAVVTDCNQNAFGFDAALETARVYHDKLSPDISDIRDYALNTLKPYLDQIKSKLNSGNTTGGQQ